MDTLSITKWMVSEFYNFKMGNDIKANGSIIKNMDLDSTNGRTDVFIRAATSKEKEMEKEKWFIKMENSTREIGLMGKNTEKAFIVPVKKSWLVNGARDSLKRNSNEIIFFLLDFFIPLLLL